MTLFPIEVGARSSPLALAQVEEVLEELKKKFPSASFQCLFKETYGDRDLKTSLRTLGQTDFFTREIDEMLLKGTCRIAIHSAKDLPFPLPKSLQLIALTRGIDPADALVLREFESLESLPKGSLIATSSSRREEMVKELRSDFDFCDLRGTIETRLNLLKEGKADGVVIAEAALIRLKLTHLNRVQLRGKLAPLQGQLAILAREDDDEMKALFRLLDARLFPKALYLGEEFPLKAFPEKQLIHTPLIETKLRSLEDRALTFLVQNWEKFTHLLFTSKSSVKHLAALLRKHRISPFEIGKKQLLAVGRATAEAIFPYGGKVEIASSECAEGVLDLIDRHLKWDAYPLWPHSSRARPLIGEALKRRSLKHFACALYDTRRVPEADLTDLKRVEEVIFSSPSTVEAFFQKVPTPPKHLKLIPIGFITEAALAKYSAIKDN